MERLDRPVGTDRHGVYRAAHGVGRSNSGNGKQITGFNLTGQTSGFTATGGAALRTVPCPEGSFMYMNLGQGDLFGKTQITGGLKVNGIDLPNTSVVPAI